MMRGIELIDSLDAPHLEAIPVRVEWELRDADKVLPALALAAAAIGEDEDAREVHLLGLGVVGDNVVEPLVVEERAAFGFREDAPDVGGHAPLAGGFGPRRVGHYEHVHVAPQRVLACTHEGNLVLVLRREISRDAHLPLYPKKSRM